MFRAHNVYSIKKIGLILLALTSPVDMTLAEERTIFIHDLKPFSYMQDGKFKGFAVEIVREMAKSKEQPIKFMVVPFKRGLREVQRGDNRALLIVAKRPERQNTVKWVGPLISSNVYFYKKKGKRFNLQTIDDVRENMTVGVALGNADHTYLKVQDFTNLVVAYSQEKSVELLIKDRFDVTPSSEIVMSTAIRELGIGADEIEKTDVKLYHSTLYLAFSLDTSDKKIEMWQSALDALKDSGKYQDIYNRYIY